MSDTQKLEDKETPFSATSHSVLHDDVTRFLPDAQSVIQKALTSPLGCDEDSDHAEEGQEEGGEDEGSEGSLEWEATSEKSQDDVIKEAVDTLKVYTLKIFFMSYHVFVRLSQKYP